MRAASWLLSAFANIARLRVQNVQSLSQQASTKRAWECRKWCWVLSCITELRGSVGAVQKLLCIYRWCKHLQAARAGHPPQVYNLQQWVRVLQLVKSLEAAWRLCRPYGDRAQRHVCTKRHRAPEEVKRLQLIDAFYALWGEQNLFWQ